jgi:hypothetical protein
MQSKWRGDSAVGGKEHSLSQPGWVKKRKKIVLETRWTLLAAQPFNPTTKN